MTLRLVLLAGLAGACLLGARVATDASAAPGPASPPSRTSQVQMQAGMQPGEYHSTITFSDVTGLPPAVARRMTSRGQNHDACLRTGDINAVVQDTMAAGANMTCSEDQGSASAGVISGAASCHDNDGNSGTLTISGTYTATHADVGGDLNAQTPLGPVSEHIHLVSDRTGACS